MPTARNETPANASQIMVFGEELSISTLELTRGAAGEGVAGEGKTCVCGSLTVGVPGAAAEGFTAGLTAAGATAGAEPGALTGEAAAAAGVETPTGLLAAAGAAAGMTAGAGAGLAPTADDEGRGAAAGAAPTPGVIFAVPDFGGAAGIFTRVVSFFGAIKGLIAAVCFAAMPDEGAPGMADTGDGPFPGGGGTGFVAAAGFGGNGIRTVSFFAAGFAIEAPADATAGTADTGMGLAGRLAAAGGGVTGLGGIAAGAGGFGAPGVGALLMG